MPCFLYSLMIGAASGPPAVSAILTPVQTTISNGVLSQKAERPAFFNDNLGKFHVWWRADGGQERKIDRAAHHRNAWDQPGRGKTRYTGSHKGLSVNVRHSLIALRRFSGVPCVKPVIMPRPPAFDL
jgi:hypothetical protein